MKLEKNLVPIPRTEEENAGIMVVTDMPIDGHSRQATVSTRDGNVKLCSYPFPYTWL